jgi:cell cycle checkpoint protein
MLACLPLSGFLNIACLMSDKEAGEVPIMSVHCRLSSSSTLLRVLHTLSICRDTWSSCVFTRDVLIFHTAGDDQASTASATIPRSMFAEYIVSSDAPRFMVHVQSLVDALLMGGSALLHSTAAKFILAFPTGDGRLLVELEDPRRTIRSTLSTRPVKERLLDMRFGDALSVNRITIRGDAVMEILGDISAFQADTVQLAFTPTHLRIVGLDSPLGTTEITIGKKHDAVLGFDVGDTSLLPKFHSKHLMRACGLGPRGGSGSGGGSNRGHGMYVAGDAGGTGGFLTSAGEASSGFERLTLMINAERQLCVMHQGLDHSIPAMVNVVISSVCELEDM